MTEHTIESEQVFDGTLLKVYRDRVRLPNGHESAREWIDHPGAAAVVPLLADGRVVLVRQFRYPLGAEGQSSRNAELTPQGGATWGHGDRMGPGGNKGDDNLRRPGAKRVGRGGANYSITIPKIDFDIRLIGLESLSPNGHPGTWKTVGFDQTNGWRYVKAGGGVLSAGPGGDYF